LKAWTWEHGYDIQKGAELKWVCRHCIARRTAHPEAFKSTGLQNTSQHLYEDHNIPAPEGESESKAQKHAKSIHDRKQQSLFQFLATDPENPRDQAISNKVIRGFDKKHFQRLLLEWIVEENLPFTTVQHEKLRAAFEYLNPCVADQNAHISNTELRKQITSEFLRHQETVIQTLQASPGRIHVSFDGWRSGNRRALYGVVVFFQDEYNKPCKLVLGIPEISTRHTGQNIASQVFDVLKTFRIENKVGFLTLDNAANMDTTAVEIGNLLGFDGKKRRGRCFGHQLNLSAKSLLFGTDVEAFEAEISEVQSLSAAEHTLYRKRGPVGKAHNLVVDIWRSDRLYYILLDVQQEDVDDPSNPLEKPLCVVLDNDTRWLSQLYMIRRLLKLRPYIPRLITEFQREWEDANRSKRTGHVSFRALAQKPRILKEQNQLNEHDWEVLEHTAAILSSYECTVKSLEGDGMQRKRRGWTGSYGNIWEVIFGFEFLLEQLEYYKAVADTLPDGQHFKANINLGWQKLDEYYNKLDETPIYYAAIALHPKFRWTWFETKWNDRPEWIQRAKELVQELWNTEYRNVTIHQPSEKEPPQKRQKTNPNPFEQFIQQQASTVPVTATRGDEYEAWQSLEAVNVAIDDPLAYWHENRHQYPRLSKMALDILTVQPMSAECERLFSAAGQITSPLRNALDALIIGMCQVLRSWLRAGVIKDLDPVLSSLEDEEKANKIRDMSTAKFKEWTTSWLKEKDERRKEIDEELL
jgi:hypothetical protein